jgi:hypothetical protein
VVQGEAEQLQSRQHRQQRGRVRDFQREPGRPNICTAPVRRGAGDSERQTDPAPAETEAGPGQRHTRL